MEERALSDRIPLDEPVPGEPMDPIEDGDDDDPDIAGVVPETDEETGYDSDGGQG